MLHGITASSNVLVYPAMLPITGKVHGGAFDETVSYALAVTGGVPPYTWDIASGALPGGWTINASTGAVGGAASATGYFTFEVRATDDVGQSVTQSFTVGIGTLQALVHCDDASGSTTMVDAVTGAASWTRSGTCVTTNTQQKFGACSMRATGNGRFTRTAAGFAYGTGDFMIDFWARPQNSGVQNFSRFLQQGPNSTNGGIWIPRSGTTNPPQPFVQIHPSGSYVNVVIPGVAIANDTWHHIALGRKGTQWYFFLNGVHYASISNAANISQTAMYLGGNSGTTEEFDGCMDEIRVMSGACRWIEAFDVPTAASDYPAP